MDNALIYFANSSVGETTSCIPNPGVVSSNLAGRTNKPLEFQRFLLTELSELSGTNSAQSRTRVGTAPKMNEARIRGDGPEPLTTTACKEATMDDYSPITWARFWSKVSIPSKAHHLLECWTWTGSTAKGYGQIKIEGDVLRAHRVAFEMFNGPLPDGMHALHTCDNPLCCNPRHLWAGSHLDNMRDKSAKGRAYGHGGQ